MAIPVSHATQFVAPTHSTHGSAPSPRMPPLPRSPTHSLPPSLPSYLRRVSDRIHQHRQARPPSATSTPPQPETESVQLKIGETLNYTSHTRNPLACAFSNAQPPKPRPESQKISFFFFSLSLSTLYSMAFWFWRLFRYEKSNPMRARDRNPFLTIPCLITCISCDVAHKPWRYLFGRVDSGGRPTGLARARATTDA